MNKLIGCINNSSCKVIKTRWFYLDNKNNTCKDVTKELFLTINKFNKKQKQIKDTYHVLNIPYEYKNGLTEYSFGCGLSHYLQEYVFEELKKVGENILSFDLTEIRLQMLTKNDINNILNCKNSWDLNIEKSLIENL
ncbi:hypothetical protein FCV38_11925 [Clostridium sporogenes]|nr:hypothetical protein [Clostridium sporogenes]